MAPASAFILTLLLCLQTYSTRSQPAAAANATPPTPAPPIVVTSTPGATASPTIPATTGPAGPTQVATSTLTLTPLGSATSTPGTVPIPEPTPPRHYVVMLVIDAGRTAYFNFSHLPRLQALMKQGTVYDRAFVGELNSSTPNVHVTFGTGTLPRENGFLGFGWAAPQTRQTVDFRTLLANREIDPVLNALPTPSIAARLHTLIPGAVSVAGSGHKDYATVGLGGGSANYELFGKFGKHYFFPAFMHAPPPLSAAERRSLIMKLPLSRGAEDTFAFRYATIVARHVKPRLLMVNLPEMDTWGHHYGPRAATVMASMMRNIDRGVGQIEETYRRLGILDRTDFVITSDHAMMESTPSRNWRAVQDISKQVGAKVVRADGESGAIWLQDPSQARAVAEKMVLTHPLHLEAIFYRGTTGVDYRYVQASPSNWLANSRVAAALQRLVDTTAGRNGPDVWTLYHENYSVVPRNVDGTWKGTHGGSSWKVQHVPLILAGPSIRRGVHSQFGARAIDIAPTVERLLGLPAIQRDGVILADALTDAMRQELHPQNVIAPIVNGDAHALRAQSLYDDGGQAHWWPTAPPPIWRCKLPPPKAPPSFPCTTTAASATNG